MTIKREIKTAAGIEAWMDHELHKDGKFNEYDFPTPKKSNELITIILIGTLTFKIYDANPDKHSNQLPQKQIENSIEFGLKPQYCLILNKLTP